MRLMLKCFPLLLASATAGLAAQPPAEPADEPAQSPPPISTTADQPTIVVQPCLGAGYVPYSYPGVDTCPCAYDGCYPPARYYCGGETYRDHWWGKWLRAHFAGGSMLDGYPCHCVFPTTGRAWTPAPPRSANQQRLPPDAREFQPETQGLDR